MPIRVLVVDDEAEVRTAIWRGLEVMGYEIEVAADGADGVAKVDAWRPEVVLLDLAMPHMAGLSAIEHIRTWSKVPIIVLSVMGEETAKSAGVGSGCGRLSDQAIGLQELHARIRVALRHAATQIVQFGDVRLDVERRLVTVAGEEVHLTPIEYELFKGLALSGGRVLTHRLLLSRVWGPEFQDEVQYLRPVITSLRKKLGTYLIKTEPAVGYRLQE